MSNAYIVRDFGSVGNDGSNSITPIKVEDTAGAESLNKPGTKEVEPFGDESTQGVHYRTLSWWQCGILMIAETISLGILSLPAVLAHMGMVPGVLLIAIFAIMSTYTGYVIAQVKTAHPSVHSFSDVAFLMFGRWGDRVVTVCQAIVFIFIMAAHILAFTVMMNVLTGHATCTIVFAVAGAILSFILTMPRTLRSTSLLSITSCLSIMIAVIITMIGVGITQPDPYSAVAFTPNNSLTIHAYGIGIADIVIAFTGHTAYLQFISELRRPKDFIKSLALLQVMSITFYVVVAAVIYRYAGEDVPSPALGATSPVVRKVAYAIACPTIIVAGVINAHICVKNIYVRWWRGTSVMQERSGKAVSSWLGLCAVAWILAFIVAESIPVFNSLLGILGALFCSWFSLGLPAMFWLWMNQGHYARNWKKKAMTAVNVSILVICVIVCLYGTWASIVSIMNFTPTQQPFSCANNAS